MRKDKEQVKVLSLGFLILAALYFLYPYIPSAVISSINDSNYRQIYSYSKKNITPHKIIAVAIDDFSLKMVPQRWPWSRSVYSQLVETLYKEGANTIGFDLLLQGESEDKQQDIVLAQGLKASSCRVVLAFSFDYKKKEFICPLSLLKESCFSLGLLNTPVDKDGKVRRLRSFVEFEGRKYYSLSVELAASFLNKKPEEIVRSIPLLKDKTYFINFLARPQDADRVVTVSFYDVLKNIEKLKKQYGGGFLKDSLVLVFPEAEVLHDQHLTPLGKSPGGFLHINGVANILSGKFLRPFGFLTFLYVVFVFAAVFLILRYLSFIFGAVITAGIILFGYWSSVLLGVKGFKIGLDYLVVFSLLFFGIGSLYKYVDFFAQLLKIKYKATIDPLRGIFTLRYFNYRLELEARKIYFKKDMYLVFVYLQHFRAETDGMSTERIRQVWQQLLPLLSVKNSFWSMYSNEELVGCLVSAPAKINESVQFLKNSLGVFLKDWAINSVVRTGYLKFRLEYSIRELLFAVSKQARDGKEDCILIDENALKGFFKANKNNTDDSGAILKSLDEDIDEKNRQLLTLIESLSAEHSKYKEMFFQVITSLVNALEARDPYTEGHSQRVSNYSLMFAQKLGWNKEEKDKLKKAALLHDLGKIGIPDSILHKKGQLTDQEFDFIKKHEVIAVRILDPLKEIADILPWILYHHERWDGKGYPHGLGGNSIPQAAQIISLSDVFDALTTGRDYKTAMSYEQALEEILKNKGTQFNPEFAEGFAQAIRSTQMQK